MHKWRLVGEEGVLLLLVAPAGKVRCQLVPRSGLSISQSGLVVYADGEISENLGKCADVECAVRVVNRVVRVDGK